MSDHDNQSKTYFLTPVRRILYASIVASSIINGITILFYISNFQLSDSPEALFLLFLLILVPLYFSIDLLFSRLRVTPEEVVEYKTFWYRKSISWEDIDRLEINIFGSVILKMKDKEFRRKKQSDYTIILPRYIAEWENGDFLSKVTKFAPHIKIPEDIYSIKFIPTQFHPIVVSSYLFICFSFLISIILIGENFSSSLSFIWELGVFGFVGGIVRGFAKMGLYSNFIFSFPKFTLIRKTARDFFLLPFSGGLMGFVLGFILVIISRNIADLENDGILTLIAFLSGLFHHKILYRRNLVLQDKR